VFTAMYGMNFKPNFFSDITTLGKMFAAQILARYFFSPYRGFNPSINTTNWYNYIRLLFD